MSFRLLNNSEITALQSQGCFSSNWSDISVTDNCSTDHILGVRFEGTVKIGELGGEVITGEGEKRASGLFNCKLNNCEIGDHVLIDNVHLIRNYLIGDKVIIENVDTVSVNGPTSFGNGFEVEVLNEGGGRELMMFDRMTAQLAYMLVSYRHDPDFIHALNKMIKGYAEKKSSETGCIAAGSEIVNSGSIINMNIGEHTTVKGATLLKDGTIVSNVHAPVFIGEGVIAKNFMVLSGSKITSGALIDKCFIGQSVEMGKQYSAESSAFFANSEAFHGEAVSLFAGPYTVTHHKSSLLIAGMFSFFNTGSGTNQSNHMYKLGPVHQGIVERGSKSGSFAYMLWPSRIGAYTVVMGKNGTSFDTSDFPFSYINVDQEKSILTPGMNLFTVGTRRDSEKWPQRDKRKDPEKADLINFDFLSPYIVQKVISSIRILKELYEKTAKKQDSVLYKGIRIKRLMLKSTQKYYEMALSVFIGQQIVKKLEKMNEISSIDSVRKEFSTDDRKNSDQWIDLAGMIAPENTIQDLIRDIKTEKIADIDGVISGLEEIHSSYEKFAWDWTTAMLSERLDVDMKNIEASQLIDFVSNWKNDSIRLDKMILNDASKEFDNSSKIGFGIDGDQTVMDQDFTAVRGVPEENKFISGIHKEMEEIEEKAEQLIGILGSL